MKRAWKLVHPIKFRDLGGLVSLVEFSTHRDKVNTIREGHWTFKKHLVVFKEVEKILQIQQIHFTTTQFWLWLHDLPIFACNATMSHAIYGKLGEVIEVDSDENGDTWGNYMWVQVCLNITKPLLQGKNLSVGGRQNYWISFPYERLLNFCYSCSKLGHGFKECAERLSQQGTPN